MNRQHLRYISLLAFAALVGAARPADAGVILQATAGTPQTATGITDIMLPAGLNGSVVTAHFADGSSETRVWSGSGVSGTGWALSLTLNINTFFSPWQLSNTRTVGQSPLAITSIDMDAGTSKSVFDRTNPSPGTSASNLGEDLAQLNRNGGAGGNNIDMRVTYSDIVQSGSNPPLGDLYRLMTIEFGTIAGGTFTPGGFTSANTTPASIINPNGALNFLQDTDPVQTLTAAPEPSSLALLALGGLGLAGWRRWRKGARAG
jgi:hypothetical protein